MDHILEDRMRVSATIIIALLWLAGCGEDDRGDHPLDGEAGDIDAGADPEDAGSTAMDGSLSDSATPSGDDGGPPDAGPAPVCSEPAPGGDCVLLVPIGSFGPLEPACMPRCSAATAAAYRACDNQGCRNAAIDADTTPGTPYFIGSASISTPLDCAGCVSYQEFHCFSLVCTAEVDAYVDHCIAGVDPSQCDPSIWAIDDCLATLSPAEEDIVAACLQSADGPPGCFACE